MELETTTAYTAFSDYPDGKKWGFQNITAKNVELFFSLGQYLIFIPSHNFLAAVQVGPLSACGDQL